MSPITYKGTALSYVCFSLRMNQVLRLAARRSGLTRESLPFPAVGWSLARLTACSHYVPDVQVGSTLRSGVAQGELCPLGRAEAWLAPGKAVG